jgi:hypothetical protein
LSLSTPNCGSRPSRSRASCAILTGIPVRPVWSYVEILVELVTPSLVATCGCRLEFLESPGIHIYINISNRKLMFWHFSNHSARPPK